MRIKQLIIWCLSIAFLTSCNITRLQNTIIDLEGPKKVKGDAIWLSHEHILVDFIGAEKINSNDWDHDSVIQEMLPFLQQLFEYDVDYFVDATPNYLGRDVLLLEKLAAMTEIKIVTNTGLYGAGNHKYIPSFAYELTAEELAERWIDEFENGIDGTDIRPGFIKIGVNNSDPLHEMDQKLVEAAAITHLRTGLTIASHTGKAKGMWPQLEIVRAAGVSPDAFIWVHAQSERDNSVYLKAAEAGCWISLDGMGWETDRHIEKLLYAKENGFLDRILVSHDAGWYNPQLEEQTIQPYTNLFEKVIPELLKQGFSEDEVRQLLRQNPVRAFSIEVRKQ